MDGMQDCGMGGRSCDLVVVFLLHPFNFAVAAIRGNANIVGDEKGDQMTWR